MALTPSNTKNSSGIEKINFSENKKKKILALIGSASRNSSNLLLVQEIIKQTNDSLDILIFNSLKILPHFDPELSIVNPPQEIISLRDEIEKADGILISTPEYVFSIPSGLKNAIEWCIATTVFMNKPCGLITASASGEKGHEELQLIMKTAMALFTPETTLLIQGVKGKIDHEGRILHKETQNQIEAFVSNYLALFPRSTSI